MANDIKQIIQEANEGLRQDIRKVGIRVEAVQSDVKQILEGVETHTRQLGQLEGKMEQVESTLETVRNDVEAIKVTVEGVKRDLKGKADREELSALELKLRPA